MLTSSRGKALGCLCELPGGPWTSCSLPEIFFFLYTVLPFCSLLLGMKGTCFLFFLKVFQQAHLLGFLCQKALGCSGASFVLLLPLHLS